MDKSGTFSIRPLILVVEQLREMERFIQTGILSCQNELEFCTGLHDQVMNHIQYDRPKLIIAPLQMEEMNAADLVQEVIQKTGEAIPGIFISDPKFTAIQKKLEGLGTTCDFLPTHFSMQELLQKVEQITSPKREYRIPGGEEAVERKKSTVA